MFDYHSPIDLFNGTTANRDEPGLVGPSYAFRGGYRRHHSGTVLYEEVREEGDWGCLM